MTIEIALLISGVSLAFGIYSGLSNMKRNAKKDTADEASQMTAVIVKLETIKDGITEIKTEMNVMHRDVQDLRDRLIVEEQHTKTLYKRIEALEALERGLTP
ncbi:MAG: hypothetical protein VB035_04325 [Candidatus Fimivivens sp.]|nr:hypothetical protein [Candidatus Fimivivens sp.]